MVKGFRFTVFGGVFGAFLEVLMYSRNCLEVFRGNIYPSLWLFFFMVKGFHFSVSGGVSRAKYSKFSGALLAVWALPWSCFTAPPDPPALSRLLFFA